MRKENGVLTVSEAAVTQETFLVTKSETMQVYSSIPIKENRITLPVKHKLLHIDKDKTLG